MRIIPVLDLMGGQVVRGVAGQRSQYRPVVSRLCPNPEPLAIAEAFRRHFGFDQLYLADLDAITGQAPALDVYGRLGNAGFARMVDAGLRTADQAQALLDVGVESVVVGLETIQSPGELFKLVVQVGSDRVVFSLDLKDRRPMGDPEKWPGRSPTEILNTVIGHGVRRTLLLDLSRVGTSRGIGTEPLARWVLDRQPQTEVLVGGGVHGVDDLRQLARLGVHGVLVASALHDGRIGPDALRQWPTGEE